MDSTSKTPIDLDSNGEEITFEGWTKLGNRVYDLWLSPCGHYLVQHYEHRNKETERIMRTAFNQDVYMQDTYLRQLNAMGQVIALKNWEHMIVHQFTGCHWYGHEDFPEDFPELWRKIHEQPISWPNIQPQNLYRNPEGELRVIGPTLCFEHGANPINLNYWGTLLDRDEQREVNSLPKTDGNYLDWRLWSHLRDRNA